MSAPDFLTVFRRTDLWLSSLIHNNPLATVVVDSEYRIQMCNAAFETLFGYREKDVAGDAIDALIVSSETMVEALELNRRATGGEPVRAITRRKRKDGTLVDVEVDIVPLAIEGTPVGAYGIYRDLTAEKRADRLLMAQYSVVQALAESESLEEASPRILQAVAEQVGFHVGVVFIKEGSSGRLRCVDTWHAEGIDSMAFEAKTRRTTLARGQGFAGRIWEAGRPVWVVDVLKDFNLPCAEVAARADLHTAFGFPILFGGDALGVVEFFSTAVLQPDEGILGISVVGNQLGVFIERERLDVELRQANKLEAIGRLAGGVAHDFNNILMVIQGYSEMLLSQLKSEQPFHADLDEIHRAAQRGSGLTRQLLAFGRKQVLRISPLDLNAVVRSIAQMLTRSIGEDITLELRLSGEACPIEADAAQLEQVLVNLAVNARDAMSRGGELTIEVTRVEIAGHHPLPPGRYVRLTVSDTGSGMDEATRERLFEPFFTTKGPGQGSGLGLATVYGIVKQLRGHIGVETTPLQGTTFTVDFPETEKPVPALKAPAVSESLARGSETVLLVEDDEPVRALSQTVLRRHGYHVLEAAGPKEALVFAARYEGRIDLVLSDVIMPDMTGPEMVTLLRAIRPEPPVIYISGYATDALVSDGVLPADVVLITKPIAARDLLLEVRRVLDTRIGPASNPGGPGATQAITTH